MEEHLKQRRILIISGEASGDLHGANLIRAAREVDPGLSFFGVGGRKMQEAGCDILVPMEEISVFGVFEVFGKLRAIRKVLKRIRHIIANEKPDVVLLIDFPGFNMRVARAAHSAGVPVLYYIAPKVWAWKEGRAKKIGETVDRLAVIFPFEPPYYAGMSVKVDYVGNPLLDEFSYTTDTDSFCRQHGIDRAGKVIGLFPGSRNSEVRYNFDDILATARLLKERYAGCQFLLPLASSLPEDDIRARVAASGLPIHVLNENIYDIANACDVVLAVSGTVTLQIALTGTPLLVINRVHPLTYAIGKRVVKIPHVSLVNIIAGREVVKEYLQDEVVPEHLYKEILQILENTDYNQRLCDGLREVRELMGDAGCSGKVARIASEMSQGKQESR
ncbi:MAG: lipid-A-disaccharide synthase [Desulfuromonas sp.]|nr:MAG: lipid-A-disaccharide synthase [Desulfuromonas sp.]